MKTIMSIKTWVLTTLTTLALFACEKDTNPALSPISLDPQTISIEKDDTAEVTINGGTGPYTTRIDKTGIVSVSINDNILALTGVAEGTTAIRVADAKGSSATLTVTITYQPAELITFAALKSHLVSGESVELPRAVKIKGVVISDADNKNIDSNTAILQEGDDKGGITIQFTAAHTLKVGDEAEVEVSRLTLANIEGELTVTGVPISNATTTGSATITARETTALEIIDNKDAWSNTLVTLPGGFFTGGDGNYTGSLSYDDGTATVQSLFIAPDFGAYPAGGVTVLTGIVRVSGNDVRVDIRSLEDVGEKDFSDYFITKWDTGAEPSLVLHVSGNYDVIWEAADNPLNNGSESYTSITTGTHPTLTFPSAGVYIVKVVNTGSTGFRLYMVNSPESKKLLEVQQWGTNPWSANSFAMFNGCSNMDITATDKPDFSNTTNMGQMFLGCDNLKGENADFDWDVSNATSMAQMFDGAKNFNRPLNNWKPAKVYNFYRMFYNASAFNQPLNDWTIIATSHATIARSTREMFRGAISFNQPLNNWNTSYINTMASMFSDATAFNQSLGNWDLSSINTTPAESLASMLNNSGMDTGNYDATLKGWIANPNTPENLTLGATGLTYSEDGETAQYIDRNERVDHK